MKTLKTPEHLQKQFGIPASAGIGRAIPRVLLAYRGPCKRQFLASMISMIVSNALPAHGQNRKQYRLITQHDLGDRCNVARSTFTRWLSIFAESACSEAERERYSRIHKDAAQRKGRKVLGRDRRKTKAGSAVMLKRRRGFSEANRYELRLPSKVGGEKFYLGTLRDLKEDAAVSHLFDPLKKDPMAGDEEDGLRGFKMIPEWLWDQRLDLSVTARLVMSYYIMCGLLDVSKKTGRVYGVVNPKQVTVKMAIGCSIKSIWRANRELAALGLIRVAHPKPIVQGSRYIRGPAKILYLPVRQFTQEEAQAERERFYQALKAIRGTADELRASDVFHALLREWQGKEHCVSAFWNELRRQLDAAGLAKRTINGLVPRPPE